MIYLVTVASSLLLLFFQSPYLGPGDSAEYVLIAKTWSIAHPPGYPLYTILTKIFSLIPYSTISWRVALISSFSTAITIFFIIKICKLLKIQTFSAYISALFYLFLFPIWFYSEIPEVFTLNNLFISIITYFLILNYKKPQIKYVYLASVFIGLCLSHHHTFILFLPGWLYLLKKSINKFKLENYLVSGLIILGGLLFYFYPVIASYQYPPMDWENAKSLTGLIRIFIRAPYGTFKSMGGIQGNFVTQLFGAFSLLIFLIQDFKPIGIIFIIVGFFSLHKKNKNFFWFLFINLLFHIFFLFYANFNLNQTFGIALYERFLILVYLNLIFPFAYGINYVTIFFHNFISKYLKNKVLSLISSKFIYIFLFLYILIAFKNNVTIILSQKNHSYFDNYARDLLNTVEKGGIVVTNNDTSYFVAATYNLALKYRPDIIYLSPSYLNKKNYQITLKKNYPALAISTNNDLMLNLEYFLKKNYKKGIYFETPPAIGIWKQIGLLWKYYPNEASAKNDLKKIIVLNKSYWNTLYKIPIITKENNKILHLQVVQSHYVILMKKYSQFLAENNDMEGAKMALKKILKLNSEDKLSAKFILMNLYVFEKKCLEAKRIKAELNNIDYSKNKLFLESVLEYYQTCEPKNVEINKIKSQIKQMNLGDTPNLKNF